MTDLDVTVTITDGTAGLSDLVLSEANGYIIRAAGLGEGARAFRRQTVESPFVEGRVLVGAVLDVMTGLLGLKLEASSHAELRTRRDAVRDRMEQSSYTLVVDVEGVTDSWRCECADSAVGDAGLLQGERAVLLEQLITFTFPHQPTPL